MSTPAPLTAPEVCRALRLRRTDTVHGYLRRGLLRGRKVGRQWLIDADSVARLGAPLKA